MYFLFFAEMGSCFTLLKPNFINFFALINVNSHIIIFSGCIASQCTPMFNFMNRFLDNELFSLCPVRFFFWYL